ncbi:hypothetical protein PI124_g13634 [Phytophthora idaei]|nr:hypothetical protein PI125_g20078 [Phytophthora idaei]KAG3130399.1 hypothetical protein PI126_g20523 [Phytophthora idaei]KAG3241493.1 hypothetical protein PI124_g13634 [Phytophthora idaei]
MASRTDGVTDENDREHDQERQVAGHGLGSSAKGDECVES